MLLNSSLRNSEVVRLAIVAIVSGFLALAPAVSAGQSSSVITFDGPGAGTGSGQGTRAIGMNSKGTIVGTVTSNNWKTYGFLRQTNGKLTKVEYPGAQYTSVYGINDSGTIVGSYSSPHDQVFLRTADGKFTSFVPSNTQFLEGSAFIDNLGNVAGTILTNYDFFECYVRMSDGKITLFTGPLGFDCVTTGIVNGTVTGYYGAPTGYYAGYLRAPDGTFTVFMTNVQVVDVHLNKGGTAAGSFPLPSGSMEGFLRTTDGVLDFFTVPGSVPLNVSGINDSGAVAGNWATDPEFNSGAHGFQRFADGTISTFDAPGTGTGPFQGTYPSAINNAGAIAGTVVDSSNVSHGFLLTQ
jgi:hypothetical protein